MRFLTVLRAATGAIAGLAMLALVCAATDSTPAPLLALALAVLGGSLAGLASRPAPASLLASALLLGGCSAEGVEGLGLRAHAVHAGGAGEGSHKAAEVPNGGGSSWPWSWPLPKIPVCIDSEPTNPTISEQVCAGLPTNTAECGAGGDPFYGWEVCLWGFDVLHRGAAEYLAHCLSRIPASEACVEGVESSAFDCAVATGRVSCESQRVADMCTAVGLGCDPQGQNPHVIDQAWCRDFMAPFGDQAFVYLVDCMNALPVEDACMDRMISCLHSDVLLEGWPAGLGTNPDLLIMAGE